MDPSVLHARLGPARARLAAGDEHLLRTQIALSEIPAPTGAEHARGASVAERFRALDLLDVRTDDVGNVLGIRAGDTGEAPVVVCAHLDTIFPDGTPVGVAREGVQLSGPGIVDNSRGLAVMRNTLITAPPLRRRGPSAPGKATRRALTRDSLTRKSNYRSANGRIHD